MADQKWPLHYKILVAMVIGTALGVAVNPGETAVDGVTLTVTRSDGGIQLQEQGPEGATVFEDTFEQAADFERSYPQLAAALGDQEELIVESASGSARMTHTPTGMSLTWQRTHEGVTSVSRMSGSNADDFPEYWREPIKESASDWRTTAAVVAKGIGDLFLRMLKMVTVPLILTSLITGVTGLGGQANFGRMFSRTLLYYLATSVLAIGTGLILVNIIRPGVGAVLPGGGEVLHTSDGTLGQILYDQLLRLIPTNPVEAVASGEFLSIISFAILLGLFINAVGGETGRTLSSWFESAFEVMMRMTGWIIGLAPIGVAAFMAYATATQGFDIFRTLAWYMLTVAGALLIHAVVTLPLILALVARRNPLRFVQDMSPALLTAFSTASSNATLPLTIECVEKRAGISNRISSFVLPLGATINMDGTALYEVVAVLFIAQATPGVDLSLAQQVTVALTALLASVGAAGIPHAGLVMMAVVLQAVGLPLEAQGVIIAVDRILDMCRTMINVYSDSCGCAVVAQITGGGESAAASAESAGS